jgi:hypothetical protein
MELTLKKADDELAKLGGDASAKSQWIDLLKLIDLEKDTVQGKWERTKAGIVTPATESRSRIQIPVVPSGSYDLEVKFVRVSGHEDVAVCLPAGSGSVRLIMSAWSDNNFSGLDLVNGRHGNQNETTVKPGALENGHLYTACIRVAVDKARAEITMTLDGKPYIKWAGPQQALSPDASWGLRNTRCVGLGAASSRVVFQSARLRMLSGKAVPVASNRP